MCNPYLAPLAPLAPGDSSSRRWYWTPILVLGTAHAVFWSVGPLLDAVTFLFYANTVVSTSTARKIQMLLSYVA